METLKGIKVLVTGGTGFVGSHLVEELLKAGARVVVPYRSVDPSSYFARQKLNEHTTLAYGDLKDFNRTFEIVTEYEIEYIFHLGAQATVTTAYHNPLETFQSNIIGTANILEAARLYGKVKGIIVASSDKAYGKSIKPYTESDPLKGTHPYEVSKSSADLISQTYYQTYQLPVVVTRFGNIYGPGDLNDNRIIPGIIKSILTKEPLRIRSDGTYVRDYVYVRDVVSGYIFLLKHLDKIIGQTYNISSDNSYSVISLIRAAQKILHTKVRYTIENIAINEIPYQRLSIGKITKLGWRSQFTLRKGLTLTYQWYKKNHSFTN